MRIIKPYVYLRKEELNANKLLNLEYAARLCYKSEGKMANEPNELYLRDKISRQHESIFEHEKATVYFVVDRGVTHEIVRHRIGSYSQESTRYCNYAKDKFENEITVIEPFYYKDNEYEIWRNSCEYAEKAYFELLKTGTPQEARTVLPNSLKTEIAVTYDFREWRHFFKLRCDATAHPQMQQAAIPLLLEFKKYLAPIFEDINFNEKFLSENYCEIRYLK